MIKSSYSNRVTFSPILSKEEQGEPKRELGRGAPSMRRSGLEESIYSLRNYISWPMAWECELLEDIQREKLVRNTAQVKERFKLYKDFGIEIPKDILEKFEKNPEGVFISTAEAEKLEKLALQGEEKRNQAIRAGKVSEYPNRETNYGNFLVKEVVLTVLDILRNSSYYKGSLTTLLSTCTSMRALMGEGMRVIWKRDEVAFFSSSSPIWKLLMAAKMEVVPVEFCHPLPFLLWFMWIKVNPFRGLEKNKQKLECEEKLEFSLKNNLKIKIDFKARTEESSAAPYADSQELVYFSELCPGLIYNLEILRLYSSITIYNVTKLQKILNNCLFLKKFYCLEIQSKLSLEFSRILIVFQACHIFKDVILKFPAGLHSFECKVLEDNCILQYPKGMENKLIRVGIGNNNLPFPNCLKKISLGIIDRNITLPEGLLEFKCETITLNGVIRFPESLRLVTSSDIMTNIKLPANVLNFRAQKIFDDVTLDLSLCINLNYFSVQDVGENVVIDLRDCKDLIAFECSRLALTANILFPTELSNLLSCKFGDIVNPTMKEELERLKNKVPSEDKLG